MVTYGVRTKYSPLSPYQFGTVNLGECCEVAVQALDQVFDRRAAPAEQTERRFDQVTSLHEAELAVLPQALERAQQSSLRTDCGFLIATAPVAERQLQLHRPLPRRKHHGWQRRIACRPANRTSFGFMKLNVVKAIDEARQVEGYIDRVPVALPTQPAQHHTQPALVRWTSGGARSRYQSDFLGRKTQAIAQLGGLDYRWSNANPIDDQVRRHSVVPLRV